MMADEIRQYLLDHIHDTKALERFLHNLQQNNLLEGTKAAISLLNDQDEKIRADAIWFIERLKPQYPDIVSALKEITGDENIYVRSHAVVFLVEHNLAEMSRELVSVLEDDRVDPHTRSRAAILLGRKNSPEVIDVLIRNLDNEDPNLVWNILQAIETSKGAIIGKEYALERIKEISQLETKTTSASLSLSDKADEVLKHLAPYFQEPASNGKRSRPLSPETGTRGTNKAT